MANPSRAEIREWVTSTGDMDWRSWGANVKMAVEEFGTAVSRAFPSTRDRARAIVADVKAGREEPEEAFGLLQDLANAAAGEEAG